HHVQTLGGAAERDARLRGVEPVAVPRVAVERVHLVTAERQRLTGRLRRTARRRARDHRRPLVPEVVPLARLIVDDGDDASRSRTERVLRSAVRETTWCEREDV